MGLVAVGGCDEWSGAGGLDFDGYFGGGGEGHGGGEEGEEEGGEEEVYLAHKTNTRRLKSLLSSDRSSESFTPRNELACAA